MSIFVRAFAGAIALSTIVLTATVAGAQQPSCIPNQQPLPPNYGAQGRVPPPCPPGYVPPGWYGSPYPPSAPPGYAPAQSGYPAPPPGPPPPGYAAPRPGYAAPQPAPPPPGYRASASTDSNDEGTHGAEHDATYYSVFFDLLSLRIGSFDIRGSDADARTWGFLFSIDPDVIATKDYLTYRSSFYGAIGGGSDGLEGELDWSWGVGVRGYIGDDHGPFARIGMGLEFLGNNKLYRSYFELPELRAGYQLHNSDVLFEIAGAGGLILGGRYFTGDDARRRIDTEPEVGAAFTLQTDGFRADARFMRIFARQTGPGTPIDQLKAELCINPFGPVFLCANGAWHRGDVLLPNGRVSESTALYAGGTIGIGVVRTGSISAWDD
jgi:hypothetical protein